MDMTDEQGKAAQRVVKLAMELSIAWDAAIDLGVPMVIQVDEIPVGSSGQTIRQVLARLLVQ
ncbi:hypothetical protein [Mesorhizobium carmichaelinearum]|uniref:hypothetical protein n=1 Tax=Mesorhizobium carmichaelinearum TaxID=1208188 RepID=UPI000BA3D8A6|nr:hypothetical protein [Mesorhizobium carmichaelinearum]